MTIDRSHESQENMEAWVQKALAPDSKLYRGGIIPRLKPQYVGCNYKEKSLTIAYDVEEWEMNPENAMHGGIIVTSIDTAFGVLCHYFAQQNMVTTVTISTTYLKQIMLHDRIFVTVKATSIGRNLISMTAEVHTKRDNLLAATANTTFMILRHEFPDTIP